MAMTRRKAGVPVTIRPAVPADVGALADIYLDSARHHHALDPAHFRVPEPVDVAERLSRILAGQAETSAFLVAEIDGAVVGSMTARVEPMPSPGSMLMPTPTAEVGIAVLEAWRGRGVGSRLMDAGDRWAAKHGVARLMLDTFSANEGALRLYRRLGYEVKSVLLFKPVPGA